MGKVGEWHGGLGMRFVANVFFLICGIEKDRENRTWKCDLGITVHGCTLIPTRKQLQGQAPQIRKYR